MDGKCIAPPQDKIEEQSKGNCDKKVSPLRQIVIFMVYFSTTCLKHCIRVLKLKKGLQKCVFDLFEKNIVCYTKVFPLKNNIYGLD